MKAECDQNSGMCKLVDKSVPTNVAKDAAQRVFDTYEECSKECHYRDYPHSRYKCVNGKCVTTSETGSGTYTTESSCLSSCFSYVMPIPTPPPTAPKTRYTCSNGKCVTTT